MSGSQQDIEEFKRWAGKRRTALVIQLLRGETTPAEAERLQYNRQRERALA